MKHLHDAHTKEIEKVKRPATKESKTQKRNAILAHVRTNAGNFKRTLTAHYHMQQATNQLARAIDANSSDHFGTYINNQKSGGEGYVAHGLKIVDREGFSKANRERSNILRAQRG